MMIHLSVAAIAVDLLQRRTCQNLTEADIERLGVPDEEERINPTADPVMRGWLKSWLAWPQHRSNLGIG